MAGTIAKLLISLGLESADFSKGLDGAAQQANGLGSKITGFLGPAVLGTAVAGVAAVGGAFVTAIGNAQEAQDVFAQTEAVVKSTGEAAGLSAQQMGDLASSLSAASGKSTFGDEAILQGENLLATFTEIKDPVFKDATSAMVDMAAALKTDVAGGAIQLGKALNDPIAGVSALSRVGVSFTDDQKKVIESLVKTGDVAGAQKIILAELNKEFGGSAAAAANTFSGKIATLKDKFGELLETAGTKFLPVLTTVIDTLNSPQVQAIISGLIDGVFNGIGAAIEFVVPLLQTFTGYMQPTLEAVGYLITDFMTIGPLSSEFGEDLGYLAEQLGVPTALIDPLEKGIFAIQSAFIGASSATSPFADIIASLPDRIQPVIDGLLQAFGTFGTFIAATISFVANTWNTYGSQIVSSTLTTFNTVITTATNVLTAVLKVVNVVLGEILKFWQANGQDITNTVAQLWLGVQKIIQLAMQVINTIIVPTLTGIANFITLHSGIIQRIFTDVWQIISTVIKTAIDLITTVLQVALALWNGDWTGAWNLIQEFSARFVVNLIKVFSSLVDGVQNVFKLTLDGAKALLLGFIGDASQIGSDIVRGIIDGIEGAADWLFDTLKHLASNALEAAKAAIGIGSPSKLFNTDFGQPIVEGAIKGVEALKPMLNDTLANLVTIPEIPNLFSGIPTQGSNDPFNLAGLKAKLPTTSSKSVNINANVDARGADRGAADRIKDAFKQIGDSLGNDVDLRIRLGAT